MIEAPQITTQQVRDAIIARHNEQMQDVNPAFGGYEIIERGRERLVKFRYVKTYEEGMGLTYKTFDGRKWS